MLVLDKLGRYKLARLWINDFRNRQLIFNKIKQTKVKANLFDLQKSQIVCEVKLPRNSSYYALLGCNFVPDSTGYLTVNIYYSEEKNIEVFKDSLLNNINEVVLFGIKEEYVNSILSYFENLEKDIIIPSGIINFNIGAYSEIGSSNILFTQLTEVLMALITKDLNKLDLEQLNLIVSKKI
ncbi:hypothetical protein KHQ81_08435 [Mycoplasmatota bacterium]|nr:hypothetical protein KHQ81_08435 [Mycoplasmatota bacterium]